MRLLPVIFGGGFAAAAVTVLLGLRRAAETERSVAGAVGGDAAGARAALAAAKGATTPAEAVAAAERAITAVNAAPPAAEDVREEVVRALEVARGARTSAEAREAAAMVSAAAEKVAKNATVKLRFTTYWPYTAKESEKKMEGGVEGAASWGGGKRRVVDPSTGRRVQLRTLEDHLAGRSDYVSLSGDDQAWPFGQLVLFRLEDGRVVRGRVVDTGGSFRGLRKRYRALGQEPVDVCVRNRTTKVPEVVSAEVVRGDHWDRAGQTLVASRFRGQDVEVGWCPFCVDGYPEMCDALDGMGPCASARVSSLHMLGAA